jgi:hypothetical protein
LRPQKGATRSLRIIDVVLDGMAASAAVLHAATPLLDGKSKHKSHAKYTEGAFL